MSIPSLDDGHRLLLCLVVAIRRRDAVLVKQVADKADKTLTEAGVRRAFSRLRTYGITEEDLTWLSEAEL